LGILVDDGDDDDDDDNNNNLLQLGCYLVPVVILHVHKRFRRLDLWK
jgi:hypothetical protein